MTICLPFPLRVNVEHSNRSQHFFKKSRKACVQKIKRCCLVAGKYWNHIFLKFSSGPKKLSCVTSRDAECRKLNSLEHQKRTLSSRKTQRHRLFLSFKTKKSDFFWFPFMDLFPPSQINVFYGKGQIKSNIFFCILLKIRWYSWWYGDNNTSTLFLHFFCICFFFFQNKKTKTGHWTRPKSVSHQGVWITQTFHFFFDFYRQRRQPCRKTKSHKQEKHEHNLHVLSL